MSKYIDAEKLIAEIERLLEKYDPDYTNAGSELKELLSFVTSLQQEQPEVDLEAEIDKMIRSVFYDLNGIAIAGSSEYADVEAMVYIARHFYELGLNARNEWSGVELIAAERKRQIEVEGWTKEHDAEHTTEALALAAVCYAIPSVLRSYTYDTISNARIPDFWPWDIQSWKPSPENRVRELVKAGALIAAEIDRLNARKEK